METIVNRWHRLSSHVQKDLLLWFYFFCSFVAYRAAFLFYFRNQIDPASTFSDILWIITIGFRYDSMTATVLMLFPLLITVTSRFPLVGMNADRILIIWGGIFNFLFAVACVTSKYYFEQFNNQFDHFILKLYLDDTTAILRTIWSSYPLVRILLIIGLATGILSIMLRRIVDRNFVTGISRPLIFILAIAAVAGTSVLFEQRHDDVLTNIIITNDDFLNKAVLNPFAALYYAIDDYEDIEGIHKFIPDNDMKGAARVIFPNQSSSANLDEYMKKTAIGSVNPPPRHIILVVMESCDLWPLLNKYDSLHLSDSLKKMAYKGILVRHFQSAADNSAESLFSIITGLPFSMRSASLSMRSASSEKYPSSIAETFKRLGYTTNLFYGGPLRWQNLSGFAVTQGFTAVYGSNHMPGKSLANEWGIPDEYLFDFVLSKIDDSRPSFNLIFTTSNHPPYSIDIYGKGFPLKKVPPDFGVQIHYDDLKILGHHWYADKCLGSFVKAVETRLPRTLIAVTGDHPSHRAVFPKRTFYERTVPFVLYGRSTLQGVQLSPDVAGSHIDIGPTLIELAAPKGFVYYSAGSNLLMNDRKHIGVGNRMIVGSDYWIDFSSSIKIHSYPDQRLPAQLPDINKAKKLYDSLRALGWWRVKHGAQLQ